MTKGQWRQWQEQWRALSWPMLVLVAIWFALGLAYVAWLLYRLPALAPYVS